MFASLCTRVRLSANNAHRILDCPSTCSNVWLQQTPWFRDIYFFLEILARATNVVQGTVVEAKWPKLGPSKIQKNERIGIASDFWNRYEEDILLAKDIGPTSIQFNNHFGCYVTSLFMVCLQGLWKGKEAGVLGTQGLLHPCKATARWIACGGL